MKGSRRMFSQRAMELHAEQKAARQFKEIDHTAIKWHPLNDPVYSKLSEMKDRITRGDLHSFPKEYGISEIYSGIQKIQDRKMTEREYKNWLKWLNIKLL